MALRCNSGCRVGLGCTNAESWRRTGFPAGPHCLGARLRGGGFGGATINLVRRDGLDDFGKAMSHRYKERSGIDMTPLVCQVVDGSA